MVAKIIFGAWAIVTTVASGYGLAGHVLTMPQPALTATEKGVAALRKVDEREQWIVVHVLSAECRCSQRVIEHLVKSERPRNITEKIVLVGEKPRGLDTGKFAVESVSEQALAQRFGIEAAPLMLIADPQGTVRYSGGYTDRKQGPTIFDREIIASVMKDTPVDALPLFGCAVSKQLQRVLNPLSGVTN